MNLRIISAGAGSGKTFRLTSEMVAMLKEDVRATGIIATTFTKKAAAELQERVRVRLLEEGLRDAADQLSSALIGTVHGLGVKLLRRFAFEVGVSPEVSIMADEDQQLLFNQSLATVLTADRVQQMEALGDRLGLNKKERYDWRRDVKNISDVARANNFSTPVLERSKLLSFESFQSFLGEPDQRSTKEWHLQLESLLKEAIQNLDGTEDATKKTQTVKSTLRQLVHELGLRGALFWHQWVKISKLEPGAKSKEALANLKEFTSDHYKSAAFQSDIQQYIYGLFDSAIAALEEYDQYKKKRGWIDYTDMEVLINSLLDNEQVKLVLEEELDLLMVDEFQDTSPIQLEIFLKLSQLATHSVWVGDPKQSIYGFRGADPELMQAIIEHTGGIRPEDIQGYSWRSREDIVFATNALFCKAFDQLPKEQVALRPKRQRKASADSVNKVDEPADMDLSIIQWHFDYDGPGKRLPGKPWFENCIATAVKQVLAQEKKILPKGSSTHRSLKAGDIAILCRSNRACQEMAEALHRAGLKASISRAGLLDTAESRLVMACLKYLLNQSDSLSVAEIRLLGSRENIESIIEDRLDFLELSENPVDENWSLEQPLIKALNELRYSISDLSSTEILNLLIEQLDLRRIIAHWGKTQLRLSNIDLLSKLALQYEDACNRLHTASSLGGFLLWMLQLQQAGNDQQSAAESEDAVHVLTYHKSKGLEYPLVVCHSLENMLRGDVWGIEIVSEQAEIDLNNVLGNRWLRFWVNPYADQFRKTALEAILQESEAQKEATRKALAEEARLLYVGVTRARDYLVFPTRSRPAQWLNRVWHKGQSDVPTLDHHSDETPWDWEGRFLDKTTEHFVFDKDFGTSELPNNVIPFLEPRLGRKRFSTAWIDLERERLEDRPPIVPIRPYQYATPLEIQSSESQYEVAKALKAFLIADQKQLNPTERISILQGILDRFQLDFPEFQETWAQRSVDFQQMAEKQFGVPTTLWRKYPIKYELGGRQFETIIDFVSQTDKGAWIIQNSGFTGDRKQLSRKMNELSDWFFLVQKALADIHGWKEIRLGLNFVLHGQLVEIRFENPAPKAQISMF